MSTDLAALKLKLSRKSEDLDRLNNELKHKTMNTEQIKKEMMALEEQNTRLSRQLEESASEMIPLANRINAMKEKEKEHQKSKSEFTREINDLKLKLSNQADEIEQLKNELRSKRTDIVQTKDKNTILQDQNAELALQIEDMQNQLSITKNQRSEIQRKLELLIKENEEQGNGKSEMTAEISSLKLKLTKRMEEIEYLNKELEIKSMDVDRSRKELVTSRFELEKSNKLSEKVQKLEIELTHKEAVITRLEPLSGTLKEKSDQISDLESVLRGKNQRIKHLEASADERTAQLDDEKKMFQIKLQKMEDDLEEKSNQMSAFDALLREKEQRIKHLEASTDEKTIQIKAEKKTLQMELQEKEDALKEQRYQTDKRIEELEDQVEKQVHYAQESQLRENELTREVESLKLRAQELQEEIKLAHGSEKHVEDIENLLKALQEEHDKKELMYREEIERLQTRTRTLQETVEDSENHVVAYERVLNEKRKDFESRERLSAQKSLQLEARNHELQKDIKHYEERIHEISDGAANQINTLENLLEEKRKAYEHTEDLNNHKIDDLETRVLVLQGKLNLAERKMNETKKEAYVAENELQKSEEEYARKQNITDKQIRQLEEHNQSLRNKLFDTERRNEEILKAKADDTTELHLMKERQREYEQKIDSLTLNLRSKQEELDSQGPFSRKQFRHLARDKDNLESKWRETSQRIRELESQAQVLQDKLSAVENENEDFLSYKSKMEHMLREKQEGFDNKIRSTNCQMRELEDQKQIVCKKLTYTEEKLADLSAQNQLLEQDAYELATERKTLAEKERQDLQQKLHEANINAQQSEAQLRRTEDDLMRSEIKIKEDEKIIEDKDQELTRIKDLIRDILQDKYNPGNPENAYNL
ncbi:unnamed protein product [Rhizopus stolonifer]